MELVLRCRDGDCGWLVSHSAAVYCSRFRWKVCSSGQENGDVVEEGMWNDEKVTFSRILFTLALVLIPAYSQRVQIFPQSMGGNGWVSEFM